MKAPALTVITAKGDLDWRETREIVKAIDEIAQQGERRFVIEWSQADYINPLAIGVLLKKHRELAEAKGVIKFAEMNSFVREIFSTYRVDDLVESYTTIREAILSFDEEWDGDGTTH